MIPFLIITYICIGVILILADSMTVQLTAKNVFYSDITFAIAVLFWPLVIGWARWKWNRKLKG